jgi:hypothetical protein
MQREIHWEGSMYQVDVDQIPFEQRIKQTELFWCDPNIEHHFGERIMAIDGGSFHLQCVFFDHHISTEEAYRVLKEEGVSLANPAQLISFAERFPDEQEKEPIYVLTPPDWRDNRGMWRSFILVHTTVDKDGAPICFEPKHLLVMANGGTIINPGERILTTFEVLR